VGFRGANGIQSILVLFPEDERVIPIVVDPPVDRVLQLFEVHDSANLILLPAGQVNLECVIVSVQISALSFVTNQAMASTEGKSSHDAERHGR
jgi:hypothetical protein